MHHFINISKIHSLCTSILDTKKNSHFMQLNLMHHWALYLNSRNLRHICYIKPLGLYQVDILHEKVKTEDNLAYVTL